MFLAALFIKAPNWKEPKCSPTGEWVSNLCRIYTRMLLNGEQKARSYSQKHDESKSFMFNEKKTANDTYSWFHLIWNSQAGKTSLSWKSPKQQ